MAVIAPKYLDSLTGVRCRVNKTFLELYIEQEPGEEFHAMAASQFDVSRGRPRSRSVDSSTRMPSNPSVSSDGSWPLRPFFQPGTESDARSDSQKSNSNDLKTASLCSPLGVNSDAMSTRHPSPRDRKDARSDSIEDQKEKPKKKLQVREPKGACVLKPILVPGEVTDLQPTIYPNQVVGDEGVTSVMIRNIACRYTKEDVVQVLNSVGLKGTMHFVYLPLNTCRRANRGYAFVSFDSIENAQQCEAALAGRVFGSRRSSKICEVCLSRIQDFDEVMRAYKHRNLRKCLWMAGDDAQTGAHGPE